jgi:hypothetical protein
MSTPEIPLPRAIDGGFRIKTTEWGHLDVLKMLFGNWRLVLTSLECEQVWLRGWCYTEADSGGQPALLAATLAAMAWDGSPESEPAGWYKEVGTGRRRPLGDPGREHVAP